MQIILFAYGVNFLRRNKKQKMTAGSIWREYDALVDLKLRRTDAN